MGNEKRLSVATTLLILSACGSEPEQYASSCATPPQGWLRPSDGPQHGETIINTIWVEESGRLRWNGAEITRSKLSSYLKQVRQEVPRPLIRLSPLPKADCKLVRNLRQEMQAVLGCKIGGCGEGVGWH